MVLLLARARVDKRSICRKVARIEGCTAAPLPRMNVDELREAVQFELDERPRSMRRKLSAFADTTDVAALPATTLREFLRAERGEEVVAVDVPVDSPEAARALLDFAKSSNLVAWDELAGGPLRRPKKARVAKVRKDYATVCEDLTRRGFEDWFWTNESGFYQRDVTYSPEEMEEVECHRFPDGKGDGSVLRALRAPDGAKGLIRQAYGKHRDTTVDALLRRIPGAKH
jgi:hypothetical protein